MSTKYRVTPYLAIGLCLLLSLIAPAQARATEPAQDEDLAYSIGVQTYISGFPLMDLSTGRCGKRRSTPSADTTAR